MKKFKARILSLVLTFMMVLSLAMGMEPMNIYAEVEPVKQSVEYDIFDLKVGDRLYDGDTVTDSSGVSNIRYCRYGLYADATNWENNVCVIEAEPRVISESPLKDGAAASGWEVFDVFDEGEGRRVVQVRANDETGIYAQLTEPEVSLEKNEEGKYELSIQKEDGFTYLYMYMSLGEDLGDGTIVTYDAALEMAAEMLEEELPERKTLYKVAYDVSNGIEYEEEVEFGEKGALVYVVKCFNDGNRWIDAGFTVLVAGETCNHDYSKDPRGHWGTCSKCNTSVGDEEYPEPHMDKNSDNKCDACGYTVYHVTLNPNGVRVYSAKVTTLNEEYRLFRLEDEHIHNGAAFLVPEGCQVGIICREEFNNGVAPGAKTKLAAVEGIDNTACIVSDFTRDTVIVLNANAGEVEADVDVNDEAPIQSVEIKNSIEEFIEAPNIFTVTEMDRILTGVDAKVWLDVNKLDTVPNAHKTAMEAKAAELGAGSNITYFDAGFFKQVGNDNPQLVSEPGIDIEITIEIPHSLLNSDESITRTYQLLRYHDGEGATVINGTFSDGKFTFKTNKFSTYAIIYKDVAVSNPNDGDTDEDKKQEDKNDTDEDKKQEDENDTDEDKKPEDENDSDEDKKQEDGNDSDEDKKQEDGNDSDEDKKPEGETNSDDGEVDEVPETGDNNSLYVMALMLISSLGIYFLVRNRRFMKNEN